MIVLSSARCLSILSMDGSHTSIMKTNGLTTVRKDEVHISPQVLAGLE